MFSLFRVESAIKRTTLVLLLVCLSAAGALAQMMASGPKSEGQSFDMMTSSRYIDRFEKKQGSWKIAFRRLSQDWKQIFPVTAQTPQNNPDWLSQRRDSTDALYEERAKLGIT